MACQALLPKAARQCGHPERRFPWPSWTQLTKPGADPGNAAQPVAEIARKVGLSVTPCWRRIQRLEESGVIRKRVALDGKKIGVPMSVFVALRTNQHNAEWLAEFARLIAEMPEVVEFYRMSGEVDYMLRVVVADMNAYDAFTGSLSRCTDGCQLFFCHGRVEIYHFITPR